MNNKASFLKGNSESSMSIEKNRSPQKLESFDCEQKQQELESIAHKTFELIRKNGADCAELSLGLTQGVALEIRNQAVETLEFNCDKGLSITIYRGKRKGYASTTDVSEDGLKNTVNAAISIANYTAEDRCSGLADKEKLATEFPDLKLYHPWDTSVDEMIDVAMTSEKAALDYDQRISNSNGSSISTYEGLSLLANTHGFMGFNRGTRHSLSTVVIANDNDGMQRDYYFSSNRDSNLLLTPQEVGEKAAQKTLAKLNARAPDTGLFKVLFSPEMARTIIGHFLGGIKGGQLYRKTSFLVDALGKEIFPSWINISENPHLLNGHGSKNFDSEGVATKRKKFIEDGKICNYILSSYSARRLGMETTGNAGGVSNIMMSHQDQTQQELIQSISKGLLVTELMGQGVNMVTGDYSRGASGYWIENGKIVHPVKGVTIAGNLKEMFSNIKTMGNDIDKRSSIFTGSLLIDGMTVAN